MAQTMGEILALREKTGCCVKMCKAALDYAAEHNGGEDMAIAYCKAKTLAVYTSCSFDERVQRFMEG